ncbi:Gfo/Idh/MocA family oxidoreductase [Paenibacillus sp. F411]|uniref:Gfo/Idh/MocA family protein n=1 Tax=Paenibacillus sp. F411 TaxID=2820239 RepID=UPI001AAFFF03|nr:Gfo/Idh/MocA family oxidoreductase [Paenibacillus sp. F411]MBO2945199.1 Gfo/Idh/MocA family oxidoreductase [Paenibacillus sp. F411]
MTIKGLIVGAGHFADIQLEAWAEVQGARIVGVLSRTREDAQPLADKYGLEAFGDWEHALDALSPDFIDICTPPPSHLHYTRLAADRGLPILCQKPLAPSLQEAEELVAYCEERSVPLMVNENWRWQAWYREIKTMMDAGMLGEVYSAYMAMRPGDGWGEQPYSVQPYFREMKQFLIYETGIHYLDTYRYLFGEIESLYCQLRTINPVIQGEDLAMVHLNFTSGATGLYDANRVTYMEQVRSPVYGWMTLEGTSGKLRLEEDGAIYFTPRDGQERRHEYHIPAKGWKGGCTIATQQHFVDVLRDGGVFETNGRDYMASVRAVYACYESAAKQQVVVLNRKIDYKIKE